MKSIVLAFAMLIAATAAHATTAVDAAGGDAAGSTAEMATSGDLGNGWPAGLEMRHGRPWTPRRSPKGSLPWLRSATSARIFIAALPRDRAEAKKELELAIATIVARHGHQYEETRFARLFASRDWYLESRHYTYARLTEAEREALDLLVHAHDELPR